MIKEKSTPRPWKVSNSEDDTIIIEGAACLVAEIPKCNPYPYESNAALIVTAVNLYDAHKAVVAAANVLRHTIKIRPEDKTEILILESLDKSLRNLATIEKENKS